MSAREADEVLVSADASKTGRVFITVVHGRYETALNVSAGELVRLRAAIDAHLSTPPAEDAREAEMRELHHFEVEQQLAETIAIVKRAQAAVLRHEHTPASLHMDAILNEVNTEIPSGAEVRPRGTVTDAEVLRAKAAALTEFADAVRMPFTVFRGDSGEPITPGDLMRETAARYLAEAEQGARS